MTDLHSAQNNAEKRSFFRVSGLDCGSCAMTIETALGRVPGVKTVDASIPTETVTVLHRADVSAASLANRLNTLGYRVSSMGERSAGHAVEEKATSGIASAHSHDHAHEEEDDEHDHNHGADIDTPWWRQSSGIIVLACATAIGLSYLIGFVEPAWQTPALLASMLVGLVPVGRKAIRAAMTGSPFSIETLLVIAAIGAVILGATDEAAFVVLLFLIGELLEGIASGQARRGIRGLTDLIPKTTFVENGGELTEVAISDIKIGTVIVVRPGDRIPADGEIVSGASSVDESPVTGESAPKQKVTGQQVFAGSINQDAMLRIRVTTDTANNTIARIVRLVEEAQERKSPTQRFINRFSRIYTPIVFAVGLAVAVIPPMFGGEWVIWIYRGLAVLLIGCPCALVISTPAAIASGIASGARKGLLLKGGYALEKLSTVTTVAFDKTGTLTSGLPSVTDIYPFNATEKDVLAMAAAVEATSSHPLAKAVVSIAKGKGLDIQAAENTAAVPGRGVTGSLNGVEIFLGSARAAAEIAQLSVEQNECVEALYRDGKTVVVLMAAGAVTGIIGLRDELKQDAVEGIARLRAAGIQSLMLTGDNKSTATAIADQLGMEPRSELLPQDKMEIVTGLQKQGKVVAKVGDGINDAPALAAADVGIAMAGGPGGGTDIALETGDAAILQGRVGDVAAMIDLAKRTMRNIHQNLVIALGLKGVFLVTTIIGITGLWPAILADTGATILVTANALRLLKPR